jgi:hypothetical protein
MYLFYRSNIQNICFVLNRDAEFSRFFKRQNSVAVSQIFITKNTNLYKKGSYDSYPPYNLQFKRQRNHKADMNIVWSGLLNKIRAENITVCLPKNIKQTVIFKLINNLWIIKQYKTK